jgi:hypothetical protein
MFQTKVTMNAKMHILSYSIFKKNDSSIQAHVKLELYRADTEENDHLSRYNIKGRLSTPNFIEIRSVI